MPSTQADPRPASRGRRRAAASRALALVGAGLQVVAVFLPWAPTGWSALDLGLLGLGERLQQPTVAIVLVALAALAAVPALVRATALAPLLSAAGTGTLALVWVAAGPGVSVPSGAAVALTATVVLLSAAALARGARGAAPAAAPARDVDDVDVPEPGFEVLDHTADVAFAAWGTSRAACFSQAMRALVACFAEVDEQPATRTHDLVLEPAADEDLLVDLLGEVTYLVDARGELAVGGVLGDRPDGGLAGHLDVIPLDAAAQVGAVPKAITYHGLRVERDDAGTWRCHVTIDV